MFGKIIQAYCIVVFVCQVVIICIVFEIRRYAYDLFRLIRMRKIFFVRRVEIIGNEQVIIKTRADFGFPFLFEPRLTDSSRF